ncbi:unnamed protein product, partial [Polarella glacialis]
MAASSQPGSYVSQGPTSRLLAPGQGFTTVGPRVISAHSVPRSMSGASTASVSTYAPPAASLAPTTGSQLSSSVRMGTPYAGQPYVTMQQKGKEADKEADMFVKLFENTWPAVSKFAGGKVKAKLQERQIFIDADVDLAVRKLSQIPPTFPLDS